MTIKSVLSWIALVLLIVCIIGVFVVFNRTREIEAVPLAVLALVSIGLNTWNSPSR